MRAMRRIWRSEKYRIALLGVTLLGATAWGQQDSAQAPATRAPATQTPSPPGPGFGQDPPPPQVTLAPPVTSLDQASLEPTIAVRSFLQPGVHVTESVNSNFGTSGTVGITRFLGSLDLTRIWSRYAFVADYVGGAALYSDSWDQPSQVHEMAAAQRYSWRTGQLQARDNLAYLPEGAFGFSGFNGAGGGSLGGPIVGGTFGGGGGFGSVGKEPRLTNAATLDLRESLSPRSSVTAAVGYTFTDFLHSKDTGTVNSHQESAQAGYSRVLNHFDQLGLQYGFEQFQFPQANARTIVAHTVEGLYEHEVSGRMDLTLGAGPEFIIIRTPATASVPAYTSTELTASARAILRYRFPRDTATLSYNRHVTAGSRRP